MHNKVDLRQRILELDGLRGIAIGLVLVAHYVAHFSGFRPGSLPSYVIALFRLTGSGVDLFFVLSGFLIGGILLDQRGATGYFKVFYIRRFFRIVPIYALLCLALGLLVGFRDRLPSLAWLIGEPMPWYTLATYTQNIWQAFHRADSPFIGVTWSLAVEEQFYLVLPLIVRYVRLKRLPYVLGAFIIGAPILRTWFHFQGYGWAAFMLTPCRADSLMFGVAAALLMRSPGGQEWLALHRRHLYGLLGICSVGMAWLTLRGVTQGELVTDCVSYSLIALFYLCILLLGLIDRERALGAVLRFKPLIKLGGIAYGVYLFHLPVLGICFAFILNSQPRFASLRDAGVIGLALALTILIAKLSWKYFEKPLVKRGHLFQYGQAR